MKFQPVFLAVAFALIGCGAGEEPATEMPPMATFAGKPDSKYVGSWKNELSKYTFKEDGSFTHEGKASFQGRELDNDFEGKWGVEDGIMYFDARNAVSKYKVELNGDELKFTGTGSMKQEIVLKKE